MLCYLVLSCGLATFSCETEIYRGADENNNPCTDFIKFIYENENKINYPQIVAYTEKELELRKDLRNTIKESMPTGSVGNAWVWSDSGNSLVRASTNNQLNYNVNFKPFNITSHLAMLGSVSKRDRVASAKEKVDEAIGNLYSNDKTKQMQAYSFLSRVIKGSDNNLTQCLNHLNKVPEEPPKSKHEIEIKPIKIEVTEKEETKSIQKEDTSPKLGG